MFGGAPVAGARRFAVDREPRGATLLPRGPAAGAVRAGAVLRDERRREAGGAVVRVDGRRVVFGSDAVTLRRGAGGAGAAGVRIDRDRHAGARPAIRRRRRRRAIRAAASQLQALARDRRGGARAGAARRTRALPRPPAPPAVQLAAPRWAIAPIDGGRRPRQSPRACAPGASISPRCTPQPRRRPLPARPRAATPLTPKSPRHPPRHPSPPGATRRRRRRQPPVRERASSGLGRQLGGKRLRVPLSFARS